MDEEAKYKEEKSDKQEERENKDLKKDGKSENKDNNLAEKECGDAEAIKECEDVETTVELEEEIIADVLEEKVDSLQKKLQEVENEKDSIYKKAQRLKADFVNFRKRTAKEKLAVGIKAKTELFCEILPVLDNFERALDIESDDKEFKKGVEMIYKQFINTLRQKGLTKIDTLGEEFDHRYHEAISQVENTDENSGIIIEEVEKGYIFEDRIVRPAKVKVAK